LAVDDGSIDNTLEILRQHSIQDSRIRPFHQPNSGAAKARNHGLREARGKYIAFLDADDTWHPNFFLKMAGTLDQHAEVGIAYCGWQNIGLGNGRAAPFIPPNYENNHKTESLLGGCRWPIHAAMVRQEIIREAHGFDPDLTSCMDYDLWLRIGTTHRLHLVPEVLAFYHFHGGEQITKNRARIALNHWHAQIKFLHANPDIAQKLGMKRTNELTTGELLHRGYESYWKRDLSAARAIFRKVMKQGYGTLIDWKYMLPSLLPVSLHKWLTAQRDKAP
jgi:glycosyltransferase involved in cell wall biosynthesis